MRCGIIGQHHRLVTFRASPPYPKALLRVEIERKHPLPVLSGGNGQIPGECRFPGPALLSGNDKRFHVAPYVVTSENKKWQRKAIMLARMHACAYVYKHATKVGSLHILVNVKVSAMQFVAYYRVSTSRQGKSGLGLDAQKAAVAAYVLSKGGEVASEFIETESGKNNERPELQRALAEAKQSGAVLLIAKLDRLARNVAFIATLLESGVEVTAADMPEANRFMLHVMAAVAEHEGQAISERTKAALAAAKARGVKLGWAMPERRQEQKRAAANSAATRIAKANAFAANVLPVIRSLQEQGLSLRGIAKALNERGVKTARGGQWQATTVRNILIRDKVDKAA